MGFGCPACPPHLQPSVLIQRWDDTAADRREWTPCPGPSPSPPRPPCTSGSCNERGSAGHSSPTCTCASAAASPTSTASWKAAKPSRCAGWATTTPRACGALPSISPAGTATKTQSYPAACRSAPPGSLGLRLRPLPQRPQRLAEKRALTELLTRHELPSRSTKTESKVGTNAGQ